MSLARGDIIITSSSFSGSGALVADNMAFTPFDTSLGTLNSVNVSIQGTVSASGAAVGPALVRVDQEFSGLAGNMFDFSTPAVVFAQTVPPMVDGFGNPLPTSYNYVTNFSHTFDFDDVSELAGFTLPASSGVVTPPLSVTGTLAGFQDTAFPLWQVQMLLRNDGGTTTANLSTGGSVIITYNFTRAPTIVPLPAAAVAGGGLLSLFGGTRLLRRRRALAA